MSEEQRNLFYRGLSDLHHLDGIRALLDWDQQVMLPPEGSDARASQLEVLSVIRHQKLLSADLFSAAQILKNDSDESTDDHINAQWFIKIADRERKLSEDFVAKRARLQTECFQTWQKAKEQSRFDLVKNSFAELLDVYREEADIVGFVEHQYDALLDQYEPEGKVSWVMPLLKDLGEKLKPIITTRELVSAEPGQSFPLSKHDQQKLGELIVRKFGLPKGASRLDSSSHPFCTTIGVNDVRITTRYDEQNLLSALSSTMHELGHALYEYSQNPKYRGSACGEIYSLGLHESQSRLVENCIGRSKPFAQFLSKTLKDSFKVQYSEEDLHKASNQVRRSFIRVDADEVTYSLHVLIRFELEIELLNGSLNVKELPERWNQKYQEYLGITPTSDKEGVLQDVHWYSGAFGYFPTYVLGNIYKGTMLKKMQKDLPNLWSDVEKGEFLPMVKWLQSNVHSHGSRLAPRQLVATLSGEQSLKADDFLSYLSRKSL